MSKNRERPEAVDIRETKAFAALKRKVLKILKKESLTFRGLREATGAGHYELSLVIDALVRENEILEIYITAELRKFAVASEVG